jgi:hypothetical protein
VSVSKQKYKEHSSAAGNTGILISVGIIALVLVGGFFLGRSLGWWGATVAEEPAVEAAPTTYDLVLHDYLSAENDDEIQDHCTTTWYVYDYSEIDAEDVADTLADLVYADFTSDGTDDTKTPDADSAYIMAVTGTDTVTLWYATDSRLFSGLLPLLVLGTNDIYIMNATEDVSFLCYDSNSLTSTINQTDYRDWTLQMNSLDAAEGTTAEITANEGYLPFYDPSVAEDTSLVIELQFNTTASAAWCELQTGYENREVASGNYLYIEVDIVLYGTDTLEIRLSSVLGTDFEIIGIVISYGYATSNTNWDTQN